MFISFDSVWLASLGWRADSEQTSYYHCTYQDVGNTDVPSYNMNTKQPYPPQVHENHQYELKTKRRWSVFFEALFWVLCVCVFMWACTWVQSQNTKWACSLPEEQDARIFQCPGEDLFPHWKPEMMSEVKSLPSNCLKAKAEQRSGTRSEHTFPLREQWEEARTQGQQNHLG